MQTGTLATSVYSICILAAQGSLPKTAGRQDGVQQGQGLTRAQAELHRSPDPLLINVQLIVLCIKMLMKGVRRKLA